MPVALHSGPHPNSSPRITHTHLPFLGTSRLDSTSSGMKSSLYIKQPPTLALNYTLVVFKFKLRAQAAHSRLLLYLSPVHTTTLEDSCIMYTPIPTILIRFLVQMSGLRLAETSNATMAIRHPASKFTVYHCQVIYIVHGVRYIRV